MRLIFICILKYFNKDQFLFAHDPDKTCKTGDMVLIKELPQRLTRLLTHEVVKVVHPLGDVIDPITGKAVVGDKYRDQIKEINEIYGKSEKGFDYEKAPPRGRLEGKRDFTHGRTYIKYNEDGTEQPFAV